MGGARVLRPGPGEGEGTAGGFRKPDKRSAPTHGKSGRRCEGGGEGGCDTRPGQVEGLRGWRGEEGVESRAEALPITATLLLDEELSKRVTLSKRRGLAGPHHRPYPVPLVLS